MNCNLELVNYTPRAGENGRITCQLVGYVSGLRMLIPFYTKAEASEYATARGWTFRDRT